MTPDFNNRTKIARLIKKLRREFKQCAVGSSKYYAYNLALEEARQYSRRGKLRGAFMVIGLRERLEDCRSVK